MSRSNLLQRVAGPNSLHRAYLEVMRGANPYSAGPDKVTIEAFRRSYGARLKDLGKALSEGTYVAQRGRGVPILKDRARGPIRGNVRPITVFNVADRIVHRAISTAIWSRIRDHVHSEVSFGGIRSYWIQDRKRKDSSDPKKNVRAAARRILELRREGRAFTFETDIRDFFPSIDKAQLLSSLEMVLAPDRSLLDLLSVAIETAVTNTAEIDDRGLREYWDPDRGVPQGGVLSPLLANLYLSDFDKKIVGNGFCMVRYVDDLVILCHSRDEAHEACKCVQDSLATINLRIHPLDEPNESGKVKTRIIDDYGAFDFLGLRFTKCTLRPTQKKIDVLRERIDDLTHPKHSERTLVEVITRLNWLLRGWAAAYSFCDIPQNDVQAIDRWAADGLAHWMVRVGLARRHDAVRNARKRIGLWNVLEYKFEPLVKEMALVG